MKRMYFNKRILHRYLAYIIILPLFSTMVTGMLYKVLLNLFGIEKSKISFLMKIHQMSFLFKNSEVFYTSLLMLLIIGLVVFGYSMIYNPLFGSRTGKLTNRNRWAPQSMREYHHRYGSVIFALLLYMAITGGVYRFCRNALNIEKATIGWLMDLHHMNYLPNALSIFWILFVFTAILSIAISGTRLLPLVHNLFQSSNSYQVLNSSGSNNNNNNGGSTSIGVNTSLINSSNDDGIGGSSSGNGNNNININNSINSSDGGGSIVNSNSIEDLSESILIGINDDDEINNPFRSNINNNNNSDRLESME